LCASLIVLWPFLSFCYRSHWLAGTSFESFLYRYINVGSGVSPSLPLLFLLAGWIWWCWQSLIGVASTEEKQIVFPDRNSFSDEQQMASPGTNSLCATDVPEAAERLRLKALAATPRIWPWWAFQPIQRKKKVWTSAAAGFAAILLLMTPWEIAEAFESSWYRVIYWGLLYSSLFLVCYLLAHIIALWMEFRTLLGSVDRMPFRRGFSDLKNLAWKPLWKLAGSGRQEFLRLLGAEIDGLKQIQNGGRLSKGLDMAIGQAKDAMNKLSATYEKLTEGDGRCEDNDLYKSFYELQKKLASVTSAALIFANQKWKMETYVPPAICSDSVVAVDPPAKDEVLRPIEHFLCLFYLNIILVPLRRLQTLILAMAGVFVFILLSYSSYPFESRESFHALLISIFFVISVVVGIVYGQMYTNPLLSRITNTRPGELGLDFWVKLGTFVFVPLLSLVSVQFPEVNGFLFSWLQPALQSLK
jgi:hypothetical protein